MQTRALFVVALVSARAASGEVSGTYLGTVTHGGGGGRCTSGCAESGRASQCVSGGNGTRLSVCGCRAQCSGSAAPGAGSGGVRGGCLEKADGGSTRSFAPGTASSSVSELEQRRVRT
jgi:hypothetical protein